jgi:hypothetical protein
VRGDERGAKPRLRLVGICGLGPLGLALGVAVRPGAGEQVRVQPQHFDFGHSSDPRRFPWRAVGQADVDRGEPGSRGTTHCSSDNDFKRFAGRQHVNPIATL